MAVAEQNASVVLHGKGDLRVEHMARRLPGPGEVEIKMRAVGICGSDVHFWTDGGIAHIEVKAPMVSGHEGGGQVVAVGEGVTNVKAGDRVALDPQVPCKTCRECIEGNYNLCMGLATCSVPPNHGLLQHYHIHPAAQCHKIPDSVSFEEAAMCEPLSVGIHACRRTGVKLGQSMLITGAGPIGLVTLLTARAMGATRIVVTDMVQSKLDIAMKLGAFGVVAIKPGEAPKEVAQRVMQLLGCAVDVAIDCTGAEHAIRTAIFASNRGATVGVVGLGAYDISFPVLEALWREVDLRGVYCYRHTYPTAISMLAGKLIDVKPLITHRFALKDAVEAFEVAKTGKGGAIKVMFNFPE